MKRVITLICALVIGTMSFAQKNEIKAIEKALKSNNFAVAKTSVAAAESLLANMDDKMKVKFYFLKAKALYANGNTSDADFNSSIASIDILKKLESETGKLKYTEDANEMKSKMLESVLNKTDEALKNKDINLKGMRCIILGNGGACKAIYPFILKDSSNSRGCRNVENSKKPCNY